MGYLSGAVAARWEPLVHFLPWIAAPHPYNGDRVGGGDWPTDGLKPGSKVGAETWGTWKEWGR